MTHSSGISSSCLKDIPFACACGSIRLAIPSASSFMLKEPISSFILPLSILDISRISLIRLSRYWEERSIFLRQSSTLSGSSFSLMAIPVIPMIAFIGVRISWDMRERKSLLARLAKSYFSRLILLSIILDISTNSLLISSRKVLFSSVVP